MKGCDSHLIFSELNKFNVKISVIANGLEKYMASFLGRNLVFIDSMQFMNSSLNKFVKNLLDEDFKYSVEEFVGVSHMNIMVSYSDILHMIKLFSACEHFAITIFTHFCLRCTKDKERFEALFIFRISKKTIDLYVKQVLCGHFAQSILVSYVRASNDFLEMSFS